MDLFAGKVTKLLERSLDAAALRQKVIANNIANVDTPHFKRSEVHFEKLLQQEINASLSLQGYRTNDRHFHIQSSNTSQLGPKVLTDEHSIMNNNQNNVDIDAEMALMAQNQLRYNLMVDRMTSHFNKLRIAMDRR